MIELELAWVYCMLSIRKMKFAGASRNLSTGNNFEVTVNSVEGVADLDKSTPSRS